MKISSLETKKHLFGWSVVLGIAVYFSLQLIFSFRSFENCISTLDDVACSQQLYNSYFWFGNEYINAGFWVLVVLIILSLVRNFKKKNNQATSK